MKITELLRELFEGKPEMTPYLGIGTYGVPPWFRLAVIPENITSNRTNNDAADRHEPLYKPGRD